MTSAENQQVVEALSACRPHPPFGERVRLRGPDRCADDSDAEAGPDLCGDVSCLSVLGEMLRNPWPSFKSGAAYLKARNITLNIVACFYLCVQIGTNGVYIGGLGIGRGSGVARRGWGVSVYASIGKPQSTGGSVMGCAVVCGGGYLNAGGGGGTQFGVGTPGVFVGGQFPLRRS